MLTRKLTIKDLEQFSQVSSTAYIHNADETTFEEGMEIFGTFADDGITLVSQIESDFRGLVYCGKRLTCLAVGGVASRPELRRLGGVRRTFNAVLQNGYEKGAVVSILHPFSIDYYRKFAYEPVFKYFHITTPFKTFEKIERFSGVTLATQKDFPALSEVYHSVAKKWNMMFTRDKESAFMLTPYQSMQYLYYINDGEDKGFVLITPHRPTFTINVNEIVFSNRSALLKLLGFLRTYEGN